MNGELALELAPSRDPAARATVELPLYADGAFTISSARGEVAASIRLVGALPSAADVMHDRVVYLDALGPGVDIEHRPTGRGTEDFVTFPERPADEALSYVIDVRRVAGLRSVPGTDTLELLDASGTPRLHMEPPYIVDRAGTRHAAHVSIRDCGVDTDTRGPWNRPIVAPGRAECSLRVTWASESSAYPVKVDPGWSTTGASAARRTGATSSVLPDGRVLLVGGGDQIVGQPTTLVEIYDPPTRTWAVTAPATDHAATFATATALASGAVLVVGGYPLLGAPDTAILFDPTSATWSTVVGPGTNPVLHAATRLADGTVLICGGEYGPTVCTNWDSQTKVWTPWPSLLRSRASFALVTLADGRVLAAGGDNSGGGQQVEVLQGGVSGSFAYAGSMSSARVALGSLLLSDGRVLLAGGATDFGVPSADADIFDPAANGGKGGLVPAPKLAKARQGLSLVPVAGGVLALGGDTGFTAFNPGALLGSAEWLDVGAMTPWKAAAPLAFPRTFAAASPLPNDGVLVVGGDATSSGSSVAERCDGIGCLSPCQSKADCPPTQSCVTGACVGQLPDGYACQSTADCDSGACEQGVCCATVCSGACTSCNAADRDPGLPSGTCGPISYGKDPKDSCAPKSGECAAEGVCDGLGSCSPGPKGPLCGAITCDAGKLYFSECNGLGACAPFGVQMDCFPYASCSGAACATTCTMPGDCAAGYDCTGGVCVGSPGAACSGDAFCGSGHCAPAGVCCDKECTGSCETCGQVSGPGICGPITAGKACVGGGPPCGNGACNGTSSDCVYPGTETSCAGNNFCLDASSSSMGTTCDGMAGCVQVVSACDADFGCNFATGKCRTSMCDTDNDCVDACCNPKTHTCVGKRFEFGLPGLCVDGSTELTVDPPQCHFRECTAACSPDSFCDDGVLYCLDSSQCDAGDQCIKGTCNGVPSKLGGAGGQGGMAAAGAGGNGGSAGSGLGGGATAGTGGQSGGATAGAGGRSSGGSSAAGGMTSAAGKGGADVGGGASANATAAQPSDSSSGCGCRTSPEDARGSGLGALLVALATLARKRRHRAD